MALVLFVSGRLLPLSAALPPLPSVDISCSPERPVAQIGTVVRLKVFVAADQSQNFRYVWTVSTGAIQESGSEVQWNLNGAASGFQNATVVVTNSGAKLGDCSVQVIATEPQRGEEHNVTRETTRSFLPKGQKEEAGYGLYSYLLLGSPPTEVNRTRYLSAIAAYLTLILPLDDLQDTVTHNKLNITYLPVRTQVLSNPTPQWLLDNYDFARARVLLDLLRGPHRQGPYLLSTLSPLSGGDVVSGRYLLQDLSTVPTEPKDLVSWWILEFQNQAAQERSWNSQTVEGLALRIRTTISVLATGLPEVQKQVATWVALAK